jgi:putative hydrolase of the HAD superfamily
VTSEEVGVSKPSGGIFHAALDAIGAAPDEAVMLGDAWSTDIAGARGVGVRAIWFNRFEEVSPDPSVAELRTFEPVEHALNVIQG